MLETKGLDFFFLRTIIPHYLAFISTHSVVSDDVAACVQVTGIRPTADILILWQMLSKLRQCCTLFFRQEDTEGPLTSFTKPRLLEFFVISKVICAFFSQF